MGLKSAFKNFQKKVKSPGNGAGSRVVKDDSMSEPVHRKTAPDVDLPDPLKNKPVARHVKGTKGKADEFVRGGYVDDPRWSTYERENAAVAKAKGKPNEAKEHEEHAKNFEMYNKKYVLPLEDKKKKKTKGGTGIGSRVVR